jgi:hypothetical protein
MGDRTREATRLELMLEDASLKLLAVASSLTTVSALGRCWKRRSPVSAIWGCQPSRTGAR